MGSHYYEELAYAANVPAIKRVQHDCVCKVHRLRTRLQHDFDFDGTHVYIVKCCCLDLAKQVANALKERGVVATVHLEAKTGLTASSIVL